LNRWIENKK